MEDLASQERRDQEPPVFPVRAYLQHGEGECYPVAGYREALEEDVDEAKGRESSKPIYYTRQVGKNWSQLGDQYQRKCLHT